MDFRVLAVGDVVGNPGLEQIRRNLRQMKRQYHADFAVVNGENAAVVGITPNQADSILDAGADIVTCHVEADTEENILSALDKIHAKGKKAGVVVKPKTPASAVLPFIDKVELILVMTVEPGFGGQKFMADMMPKVQAIRGYIDAMNPACELEVDGGVDGDTCKLCIASGANVLVAGSAVYKAADIPAKIKELRG